MRSLIAGNSEEIDKLIYDELDDQSYLVNVYLNKELSPEFDNALYGTANGSGTDSKLAIAMLKGINESLERWAYYSKSRDEKDMIQYGFDLDNSTTGMAAFCSLFRNIAREKAQFEAIERWSIVSWWNGDLPSRKRDSIAHGINIIAIENPFNAHVLILWTKMSCGKYAYAFSCDRSFQKTYERALVELRRNCFVLSKLDSDFDLSNAEEKRLVYFSTESGFTEFASKLESAAKLDRIPSMPKKVIDKEIKGEWSKYTKVWRVLYEMPQVDYLNSNNNFFLF